MKIRTAREQDITTLVGLLEILTELEESFDFDREAHRAGLIRLVEKQPEACVAVAEAEGRIIGMSTGQTVISTAMGGPSVWVEDVVVHPDFRRSGVGARLLAFLEEWGETRGARRLQLLIDKDNPSALEFYRKQKWEETNFFCLRKLS